MKSRVAVLVPALLIGVLLSWPLLKVLVGGPQAPAVIPVPEKIEGHHGIFAIRPSTRILADAPARETAEYLAAQLRKVTGFNLPISIEPGPGQGRDAIIFSTLRPSQNLGTEGYELNVNSECVKIQAHTSAGLFYSVQSLLQLLPPEACGSKAVSSTRVSWTVPAVSIEDRPRFPWRGFMLDVSRHFFSKAEIERVLDLMALHKLNTFHWHLTDDQGWRIEIKRYPLLTEVGAWRKRIGYGLDPKTSAAYGPDGRYGGYYTQKDVQEIVAYAAERHITIVPEIELPGHSSAALQAYPELSCSGSLNPERPAEVYCAGKEQTFEFLENVLAEVCQLFPGRYIHLGGDEVSKGYWRDCLHCQKRMQQEGLREPKELETYVIRRVAEFLATKNRVAIGWSEIQESKLPANVALMDWTGGGVEAATQGHPVVMTPNTYCYFDYYQSRDRAGEPAAAGAYLPIDKVYSFEPIPAQLDARSATNILGAQANLWTEYVPSLKQAEYMMFPRLCALAEVAWSPQTARSEQDFTRRLKLHFLRLAQLGVNYRHEQELFSTR